MRPWGRYCVIGEHSGTTALPTQELIRREIDMVGCWSASRSIVAEAAAFVSRNSVHLSETITHRFPIPEAQDAFETYETLTTGKVLLVSSSGGTSTVTPTTMSSTPEPGTER
jgi:threonine dehydrogenase-like Zn-dependent dehydrogenase